MKRWKSLLLLGFQALVCLAQECEMGSLEEDQLEPILQKTSLRYGGFVGSASLELESGSSPCQIFLIQMGTFEKEESGIPTDSFWGMKIIVPGKGSIIAAGKAIFRESYHPDIADFYEGLTVFDIQAGTGYFSGISGQIHLFLFHCTSSAAAPCPLLGIGNSAVAICNRQADPVGL